MYLDAQAHGSITGGEVTVSDQDGSEFRAFGGQLSGTTLAVIKPRQIVQSWRSVAFKPDNPDSTLILSFTAEGNAGRIDLVHLDVPAHDYESVKAGWEKYYWTPWRAYLQQS